MVGIDSVYQRIDNGIEIVEASVQCALPSSTITFLFQKSMEYLYQSSTTPFDHLLVSTFCAFWSGFVVEHLFTGRGDEVEFKGDLIQIIAFCVGALFLSQYFVPQLGRALGMTISAELITNASEYACAGRVAIGVLHWLYEGD